MITETAFPVPPGSEVSLKCSIGYTLTGDTTVTCKEGRTFLFNNTPACKISMRNQLGNSSKILIYRVSQPGGNGSGPVNQGQGRGR